MNKYNDLSYYYDEIMHAINYQEMLTFTKRYLKPNDKILDLACGSGTLAILLKLQGYDVHGLDIAEKMIEIAKEKAKLNHTDINFYVDDMIDFQIKEKFDVITCYFDSINMINDSSKLKGMFENISYHLNDNGIFIFDVFSYSKYKDCRNLRFKENLNWFNYDWKLKIMKPNILIHKIKIKEGSHKTKEVYYEYYHDYNSLIDKSLYNIIELSGDFKNNDLNDFDERIVVVLQKNK